MAHNLEYWGIRFLGDQTKVTKSWFSPNGQYTPYLERGKGLHSSPNLWYYKMLYQQNRDALVYNRGWVSNTWQSRPCFVPEQLPPDLGKSVGEEDDEHDGVRDEWIWWGWYLDWPLLQYGGLLAYCLLTQPGQVMHSVHCTLCSTVQYSTWELVRLPCTTVRVWQLLHWSAEHWRIVMRSPILPYYYYYTTLYYTILYSAIQYTYSTLHYTILHYTALYVVYKTISIMYNTILSYTIL